MEGEIERWWPMVMVDIEERGRCCCQVVVSTMILKAFSNGTLAVAVISEVVYEVSLRQQELLCRHLPDAVALPESLKTDVQLTILPSPC